MLDGPLVEHCCYGYAMDLLVMLSQNVNFTFDLQLQQTFGEIKRVWRIYVIFTIAYLTLSLTLTFVACLSEHFFILFTFKSWETNMIERIKRFIIIIIMIIIIPIIISYYGIY